MQTPTEQFAKYDPRPVLAYIVSTLNPGGTEKLVVEMGLAFAAQYRLHVFCLDEPGLWAQDLRSQGIPVSCLWRQPGLDLGIAGRLARALRSCGAQIVHAHQYTPWFYAALSRLLFRRPKLILEEHGRFYPEPNRPRRRLVNRLLISRLGHRCVAVSEDIRDRLQRYEGLDARNITVIYNGVIAEPPIAQTTRSELRNGMGFSADSFVVGMIGRFDPIKNLPMLVKAMAAAGKSLPRLHGLLVGDGPEFQKIRALTQECGLAERVHLTGFRRDARQLVQCMDLFVLSSLSEGASIALLEATAAGVAVAVTAVGGNPEIVSAGETGWVVPSESVEALTAAIVEAAENVALRSARAAAARRRFDELFVFQRMIDKYASLYRSLLPARSQEDVKT